MIAICRTDGCRNEGAPIDVGDVTGYDENGDPDPDASVSVVCGVCGNTITDVTDNAPEVTPHG
jgi:hypothetical protein